MKLLPDPPDELDELLELPHAAAVSTTPTVSTLSAAPNQNLLDLFMCGLLGPFPGRGRPAATSRDCTDGALENR
jgi:hypothetical protein